MKQKLINKIEAKKCRSAWQRGVKTYALELLEDLDGDEITKETLLNGAENWEQYSYNGCSLIYDVDIAQRVCTNSELKRTKNGELQPTLNETWLDVQARALYQAYILIRKYYKKNKTK